MAALTLGLGCSASPSHDRLDDAERTLDSRVDAEVSTDGAQDGEVLAEDAEPDRRVRARARAPSSRLVSAMCIERKRIKRPPVVPMKPMGGRMLAYIEMGRAKCMSYSFTTYCFDASTMNSRGWPVDSRMDFSRVRSITRASGSPGLAGFPSRRRLSSLAPSLRVAARACRHSRMPR